MKVTLVLGLMLMAMAVGMELKAQHKYSTTVSVNGCYIWTDGHVQCKRPYPAKDAD